MAGGYVVKSDLWVGQGQKLSNSATSSVFHGRLAKSDRNIIAQIAEKRLKRICQGSFKLSDGKATSCGDPRDMAVQAAMERRRLADENCCGTTDNGDVSQNDNDLDDECEDEVEITKHIITILD